MGGNTRLAKSFNDYTWTDVVTYIWANLASSISLWAYSCAHLTQENEDSLHWTKCRLDYRCTTSLIFIVNSAEADVWEHMLRNLQKRDVLTESYISIFKDPNCHRQSRPVVKANRKLPGIYRYTALSVRCQGTSSANCIFFNPQQNLSAV